jgi:hypothetical protein
MTTANLGHKEQAIRKEQHLVAGRYRLHAQIGHGRLGEIFQADDEMYNELGVGGQVAIQLLPERVALDQEIFRKLKSGYTLLRTDAHPGIVPFLDFGHDGKFGYLVMDLLQGASLRSLLDDVTTLPLDEAIPVICGVGDALQFLHAKTMAHSKLSAKSIFVTENLGVRLLDVIPLNANSGILRGLSSKDPFRGRHVEGDIYGLACLTYQMLAGKHPFNFRTPAEAFLARLEPAPIDSLSERQRNAIHRGLSFDDEQKIPSVEDFFREFGLTGTERLQPSVRVTTNRDPSTEFSRHNPALTVPSDSPSPNLASVPAAPTDFTSRVAQHEEKLVTTPERESIRWMPSAVLIAVLVGLGLWWLYGEPRDNVVAVIDYVDSYLDNQLPATGTRSAVEDNTGPATAGRVLVTEQAVGSGTASAQQSYPTATAADSQIDAGALRAPATVPADEQQSDSGAKEPLSDEGIAADALASTANVPETSGSEPQFTVVQSVVSVSERDGGARITAHRAGDSAGPVVWWTSDHTAVAEEDYIPMQEPVAGFKSDEETETLYIPLINDSFPESRETFYVYLGRQNTQLGRLEPILRVQVNINDDE